MTKKQNPMNEIYQIKIELSDANPPIWRRVLVPGNFTFADLHMVIQIAMGWENSHLHHFSLDPDQAGEEESKWERKTKLISAIERGSQFSYEYDFGDSWEHTITVEDALDVDPDTSYPICVGGENACPPEDCGGMHGYYEFLEKMSDPAHEEHHEMKGWIGGYFDPKGFDANRVNADLREPS